MNTAQFASIAIAAIFVQNIVLVYMLCDGGYFKALKSPSAGLIYGAAVTAFTTLSSMLAWVVNKFLLRPFSLEWLSPIVFVIIIAALEIGIETGFDLALPQIKKSLGRLLPASAFNCAVLGLVFLNIQVNMRGFLGASFYGFCAGLGYLAALFIMSSALERVRFSAPPTVFRGLPIALVTSAIVSLAFMGFSGISI